jgi:hypothetical protein
MGDHIVLGDVLRKYGPEAFGTLGALLGLSFIEKLTIFAAIIALLAGMSFAIVGAPIITHYIEPPEAIRYHVAGGAGLVLGLSGFFLAGAIAKSASSLRETLPEVIKKWLDRKAGG